MADAQGEDCIVRSPPSEVVKMIGIRCETFAKQYRFGMAIFGFGPFRLDADTRILFHGVEPIPLGQRAVALLVLLLEGGGAPVSKEALMRAAWPGLAVEDSNLTVQIAAVRRVLEDLANGAAWIETLPRRGYRYAGPAVSTHSPERATPSSHATGLALPDQPSIAVLPFATLSGDAEHDHFIDGIVDDIVTTGATLEESHRALVARGLAVAGAAVVAERSRRTAS